MAEHSVVHFEIAGPDSKTLTDFYGKLFGWSINADNPMHYAVVSQMPDGIGGGLPQSQDGSAMVTVYVTCDDIRATLAKAQELGGTKAMDVMEARDGAPTLAAFLDPDGNYIGLIQPEPGEQPVGGGKGDPVDWFEIAGSDGKKTQDFYSQLFGWLIKADNDMGYGEFHPSEGCHGGIFGGMGDPRVTVYATVDDIDAKLATVKQLGGEVVMEKTAVPGGPTIAMFTDPASNVTGMILRGTTGDS